MSADLKTTWIVALVAGGVLIFMLALRTSEELQPDLIRVFVAIQPAGQEAATGGQVELEAGAEFRLHAVVEAEDWRGKPLYYTEADALEIGGRSVPTELIRPWNRSQKVRILWFTVEGSPPYGEVETADDLGRLRYQEIFQPDWPQAWSVPGSLAPTVENFLPGHDDPRISVRFGTQRFHVRVELFPPGGGLLPAERLRSPGASDLESLPEGFPTVRALLDWPQESLSRVFGLPQIELAESVSRDVLLKVEQRTRSELAFERLDLFRTWLKEVDSGWEELPWRPVEVNGEMSWVGPAVLRAGPKIAFAYEDRGVKGRLDGSDLLLDFDRGATVRTLGEIFVGEGLIELAEVLPGASR